MEGINEIMMHVDNEASVVIFSTKDKVMHTVYDSITYAAKTMNLDCEFLVKLNNGTSYNIGVATSNPPFKSCDECLFNNYLTLNGAVSCLLASCTLKYLRFSNNNKVRDKLYFIKKIKNRNDLNFLPLLKISKMRRKFIIINKIYNK